jgi:iron complex outermembrane recepter protein
MEDIMKNDFRTILLLSAALLSVTATPVFAQSAAPDESAADDSAPPEILVTAQRRSENIQNIPSAITALSGDSLAESGVAVLRDLQSAAPAITFTKAGPTDSVNIRGIGLSSTSANVANGVATYVDGLFQPPIAQGVELYDIQNVEILRGPQGTLVGSNSTGGAVFINTKRPELGVRGGNLNMEVGSYRNLKVDGAFNIPVGENLAIRFATDQHTRDSYYTDIGTAHSKPDSLKEHNERLSALYKANGLSVYWKGELTQRDTGGYAYQPIPGTQFNNPFALGATGIPYVVKYDSSTSNFERAFNTALEIKVETAGGVVIRSLSGYQNKRVSITQDLDGSSLLGPIGAPETQDNTIREREYTQEINIISPTDGAFNYVLGTYYQHNLIDVLFHNTGVAPFLITADLGTKKSNYAAFAQGNYKLTDKFEIQAGLRYNHFKVDGVGAVTGTGIGVFGPPPLPITILLAPQTGTYTDDAVTGKLSLNYKPDDNNLIYAFAARGYKPGGLNPPGATFEKETVWDFELGWKSSFFDKHVRTQVGAFYNRYKNFQIDAINTISGTNAIINVPGTSTIKGLEGQIQAKLGGLSFNAAVAYVDSKLGTVQIVNRYIPGATANLPLCTGAAVFPSCFNYPAAAVTGGGGPNLLSPKWTWNTSLSYKFDLGGDASLEPRINYSNTGAQQAYLTYAPQDLIAGHSLVSANITLNFESYKLEAYANNLTKEYYVTGITGTNRFFGAPREFGIRFGAKF